MSGYDSQIYGKADFDFSDIFYRYNYGLQSGRSYIFTTYDFEKKLTTNVCVQFIPKAAPFIGDLGVKIARSNIEQPLALHILIASHTLDYWTASGSSARITLLDDVRCHIDNTLVRRN